MTEATRASLSLAQANHTLTERLTGATETVAGVQLKLEWLELIFVGIYSTELANIIAEHVIPHVWQLFSTLSIALVLTMIAAGFLKPWEGHGGKKALPMMYAFLIVILGGMIFGGLTVAGKLTREPLPVVVETLPKADEPAASARSSPDRGDRAPRAIGAGKTVRRAASSGGRSGARARPGSSS